MIRSECSGMGVEAWCSMVVLGTSISYGDFGEY